MTPRPDLPFELGAATPDAELPDPGSVDLRLVVCDMDGTLLDHRSEVPAGFAPLREAMLQRGIIFTPASGRQCATLEALFPGSHEGMAFIAENGGYVLSGDTELFAATIRVEVVHRILERVRTLVGGGANLGLVLNGKRRAFIERADPEFQQLALQSCAALEVVKDLAAVDDEFVKASIHAFGQSPRWVGEFTDFRDGHEVVASDLNWVDIQAAGVHKGLALRQLQEHLGITRAQTVVFGDFHNDLPMLKEADWTFAMANGHPDVREAARFIARPNFETGVVHALRHLLGISG